MMQKMPHTQLLLAHFHERTELKSFITGHRPLCVLLAAGMNFCVDKLGFSAPKKTSSDR